MEHDEIYEMVCKERFDKLENALKENHKEVMDILRGKNDCPGLVADVRSLKKTYKAIIGAIGFVFSVVVIQGVRWIWTLVFSE